MEDSNEQEVVVNWLFELFEQRLGEPIGVGVMTSNDLVSFLVLGLHPLFQVSPKEHFLRILFVDALLLIILSI